MSDAEPADAMAQALVKLNARVMGGLLALIASAALFVSTLILLLWSGEAEPGQMLGLLHYFLPGYSVSVGGAFIGALWAGIFGYAIGWVVGRTYGPWLLRSATYAFAGYDHRSGPADRGILELRPLPFAVVSGALLGGGLFVATNWLWFRYGNPSPHLELLSYYLPGYSANFADSFAGAFWLFLYGFIAAFALAWIYDRAISARYPKL